jgi:hypothetical protein
MKHKVLGSVFVLAIALGVVSVGVRTPQPPVAGPTARKVGELLKGFNVSPKYVRMALESKMDLARPLSSYQVREAGIAGGMDFRGATYNATVSEQGFKFGSKTFSIELGSPRVRQGSAAALELTKAEFANPAHGIGEINRGAVIEKYVFENNRAEQFFTFPSAIGSGELEVRVPVTSALPGPVVAHAPMKEGFRELQFERGGLAFTDAAGATKLAYHSAIAMDAGGQQQILAPRFENSEIVLTIPAGFMGRATYPVVIDPWFDLAGSGTGGGVTHNGSVSDRPALIMSGGGLPYIAWSDYSAADSLHPDNSDIYMTVWTGFRFVNFGGSLNPGGISNNLGRSTNPAICFSALKGFPMLAWQDDSNGFVEIFCRGFDQTANAWIEFAGSGSTTGVSNLIGPSQHPTIGSLVAVIPGTLGTPNTEKEVPIVAWEDATSFSSILCLAFYPGQPSVPPVPAGWYSLPPGGLGTGDRNYFDVSHPSFGTFGGVSEYPVLEIDGFGNPVVAWQETQDGNYEIYLRTYAFNNGGRFLVRNGVAAGSFDVFPAATWAGIAGSDAVGGISNTPGLSQYPSIAVDFVGGNGISVAWQETLPTAPPGTTSQIYLRRSVNGGAWNELAGSGSGLGISQSTANATAPCVATGGNYVAVAWADDTSGNPEIYARRFSLSPVGTQWEQVGFQGSAFPVVGADTVAPIDGISKTPTLSLVPRIALDVFGSPTVAWMDGSNATFDVLLKQFSPNAPGVISGANFSVVLRQTSDNPLGVNGGTDISVPGLTSSTTVFLSGRVFTETLTPPGTALRIEVEVQPSSATFSGTPTASALIVAPDSPSATPANIAIIPFSGLPNFNYQWQARTVDQIGRHSPWFAFPSVGSTSFRIDAGATGGPGGGGGGPPPPPIVNSSVRSKSSCGLTGLEAFALLGVLRLIRRRKK